MFESGVDEVCRWQLQPIETGHQGVDADSAAPSEIAKACRRSSGNVLRNISPTHSLRYATRVH
jgi:hypothetical protein